MSDQTFRTRSRAEVRRRARLAAQGQPVDDEAQPTAQPSSPTGGSFLRRMFPPAAPLPGKPDPLSGFHYDGPLRGLAATGYLLTRRPLVWIGMGAIWTGCYSVTNFYAASLIATVTSLGTFAALVAAGWLGWQRPWAYGAAAGLLGFLGYIAVLIALALSGVDIDGPQQLSPSDAAPSLALNAVFMSGVGALAGFYGGYLRRRLAEPRPGAANNRRR